MTNKPLNYLESLGTNTDPLNGIRYSTIYGNRVSGEALEDIFQCGTDLSYESSLEDFKKDIISDIINAIESNNYVPITVQENTYLKSIIKELEEALEEKFNDSYEPYDSTYLYESDGYKIEYHSSDNSIIILKSPYYTYSRLASPCFPNGCYLLDHDPINGHKCYALGFDWYDDEYTPSPYDTIYQVSDNKPISKPCTPTN